jgi:hypothetical protein
MNQKRTFPGSLELVKLSTGDRALVVNGGMVLSADPGFEDVTVVDEAAEKLARSLDGNLVVITTDPPSMDDWNWDDILETLPSANGRTSADANNRVKVRFFNIQWDTDGKKIKLPLEAVLEVDHDDKDDISLKGADLLSDKFGWCVNSFQFETVPGTNGQTAADAIPFVLKVSTDGGKSFQDAKSGVRIIYGNVLIPGEDGSGELHINVTHEGLIADVWATREEPLDHNIGTSSELVDDIVDRLVNAGA